MAACPSKDGTRVHGLLGQGMLEGIVCEFLGLLNINFQSGFSNEKYQLS